MAMTARCVSDLSRKTVDILLLAVSRRLIVTVLWAIFCPEGAGGEKKLSFVVLLYRHGDRSPIRTFANDPYQESSWPQGFGQLSQVGMKQEYELGQFFRSRYVESGFLSETYIQSEIYVRSTDYDRTLMSAESVLAALFPPNDQQQWHPEIPWQPVPIHTVPQATDTTFHRHGCPELTSLQQEVEQDRDLQQFLNQFNDILELLQQQTGDNITSLMGAYYIFDTLYCEMMHNRSLPAWASPELIWKWRNDIGPRIQYAHYTTDKHRLLMGGPLIREYLRVIDTHQRSRASESLQSPKLVMYSAHDSTVIMFLGALRMYNNRTVPYSTAVLVELSCLSDDDSDCSDYIIDIFLRNGTERSPYHMDIPGCETECRYAKFKELVSPVLFSEEDCESHLYVLGIDLNDTLTVVLLSMIAGLILLTSAFGCIVCCSRCRRARSPQTRKYARLRVETFPEEVPMINTAHGDNSDIDD